MTLEMITEKFQEMAAKAPSIDATLKFKLKFWKKKMGS